MRETAFFSTISETYICLQAEWRERNRNRAINLGILLKSYYFEIQAL